jgi:hypothetical protein
MITEHEAYQALKAHILQGEPLSGEEIEVLEHFDYLFPGDTEGIGGDLFRVSEIALEGVQDGYDGRMGIE